jgi:hypothetical protein
MSTNQWSVLPPLPAPVGMGSCCYMKNSIYITQGGINNGVLRYDISKDTFQLCEFACTPNTHANQIVNWRDTLYILQDSKQTLEVQKRG